MAKALSVERRILLLEWLCDPDQHFADRLKLTGRRNAVALPDIEKRWNLSTDTARVHIGILKMAGLVHVERRQKLHWVARNSAGVAFASRAGYNFIH